MADGLKVSTARVMPRGLMINLRSADADAADNCVWDIVDGSGFVRSRYERTNLYELSG